MGDGPAQHAFPGTCQNSVCLCFVKTRTTPLETAAGASIEIACACGRVLLPVRGAAGTMSGPLDGVVAFVDVTNWDGANAGGWVVKRLQGLGATVVDRLTKNLTHCVFKGTDAALRSLHDRIGKLGPFPPLVVKPDWATACGSENRRALERPFMLTRPPDTVQSLMKSPSLGTTGKKKRRSMQPLPLAAYGASLSAGPVTGIPEEL